MDLLTQGLLGSAMALSIARPDEIRKAGLIGLVAGLAADVDFFIRSSQDPLLNLEFHRHFTHSIFFIPVAALFISVLLWPFFKKTLSWKKVLLFSLAGYSLSGFLDACTSYGTSLFWPVSDQRVSFNIISIIDPLLTLILLAGVLMALLKKQPKFSRLFLLLGAGYLAMGWVQHERVEQISLQLASERSHQPERILVKPTLGNLFLWRSVYLFEDEYFIDAIRLNPFTGQTTLFPGSKIARLDSRKHGLAIASDSVLQEDIDRFATFSSDYLALQPGRPDLIIDVRYANLPNSSLPLWGIQIDPSRDDQHASYQLFRDSSRATRQEFMRMLFNQKQ